MYFRLLGRLDVEAGSGGPVRLPGSVARAVVARLLLARGTVVDRSTLIDDVWGERAAKDPVNALQVQMTKLRTAFAAVGESDRFDGRDGGYRLVLRAGDTLDVTAFEDAVRAGREHARAHRHAPAERCLREGLALWRGRALDDVTGVGGSSFDAERTRLEALRLCAVEEAADAAFALGKAEETVPELTGLVRRLPLHEGIRRRLMLALYRSGRHAEALAVYEEGRQLLDSELGVLPSPGIRAVHAQILRHDPTLAPPPAARPSRGAGGASSAASPPSEAAAPPSAVTAAKSRGAGNVLRTLGPFVGRLRELDALRDRLESECLVTVVGPGGVGKTRLTLEVCGLLTPRREGVWWVDLAATDAQGVGAAVAVTLGISDAGARPDEPPHDQVRRLSAFLGGRRTVLALDNCEHVLDAVAGLVAELLAHCPQLTVVTTSREPLGLTSEFVHALAPMTAEDSAELFVTRALMVHPSFPTDERTRADVLVLARALEGLPLAVELAVPHVRVLSPREITDRLGDRFALLTRGDRTAPQRHRTLRAVLDWSYALLDERERQALTQLALYIGGCSLRSAEEAGLLPGTDREDVIHTLSQLVDKSLLSPVRADGGVRVQMLETVREYALARLADSGQSAAAGERFTSWALAFTAEARDGLTSPEQAVWLSRTTEELANLRAAAVRLCESGRAADALLLEARIGYFWYLSGRETEGIERLAETLAAYEADGPEDGDSPETSEWARHLAFAWISWLSHVVGRYADARRYGVRNLGRWKRSTSPLMAVVGPGYDAMFALMQAEPDAEDLFTRADSLLEGSAYHWDRANLQAAWSMYCLHRGDVISARRHGLVAVELAEKAQDSFSRAASLCLCGDAEESAGQLRQAREHWTAAAGTFREVGARGRLASTLLKLAYLDIGAGDAEASLRHLTEADALADTLSSTNLRTAVGNLRALCALLTGDVSAASSGFAAVRADTDAPLTRLAVAELGAACCARIGATEPPASLETAERMRNQLLEPLSRRAVGHLLADWTTPAADGTVPAPDHLARRLAHTPSVLAAFV
ncbi:BTAD domain-containing putative transcriptional regulator [Streptomyces sp. NPDC086091]|uniref:BTAD domain-containing putative transcriptional regulator n=1 Tax=Streptomyces sp. NPDC086091 TaxID=3365751 RepID=UPI00381507F8